MWSTGVLAVLGVTWFSGLAGWGAARGLSRVMLPMELDDGVRLKSLVFSLPREQRERMAEVTVRPGRLEALTEEKLIRDEGGIGIRHAIDFDTLDMSVNNLAPWGEEALAKELRESMNRSLNKERKRKKLSQRRVPGWVPVDLALDIQITP